MASKLERYREKLDRAEGKLKEKRARLNELERGRGRSRPRNADE